MLLKSDISIDRLIKQLRISRLEMDKANDLGNQLSVSRDLNNKNSQMQLTQPKTPNYDLRKQSSISNGIQ